MFCVISHSVHWLVAALRKLYLEFIHLSPSIPLKNILIVGKTKISWWYSSKKISSMFFTKSPLVHWLVAASRALHLEFIPLSPSVGYRAPNRRYIITTIYFIKVLFISPREGIFLHIENKYRTVLNFVVLVLSPWIVIWTKVFVLIHQFKIKVRSCEFVFLIDYEL